MTWPFTDLNHVLTTTRSVRLRLDYDRPGPIGLIGECLQLAVQAPTGGGAEDWRWLVVGDPTLKAELATLYHAAPTRSTCTSRCTARRARTATSSGGSAR
ncbi:nitroreductase family protein [Micromonospora matsumotoense]|uniref:nitroreductase family protein n=1 Tax=Micromonospora matsumotoense TaxID=121616 RepID=UPI00343B7582